MFSGTPREAHRPAHKAQAEEKHRQEAWAALERAAGLALGSWPFAGTNSSVGQEVTMGKWGPGNGGHVWEPNGLHGLGASASQCEAATWAQATRADAELGQRRKAGCSCQVPRGTLSLATAPTSSWDHGCFLGSCYLCFLSRWAHSSALSRDSGPWGGPELLRPGPIPWPPAGLPYSPLLGGLSHLLASPGSLFWPSRCAAALWFVV